MQRGLYMFILFIFLNIILINWSPTVSPAINGKTDRDAVTVWTRKGYPTKENIMGHARWSYIQGTVYTREQNAAIIVAICYRMLIVTISARVIAM